jgi:flagellar hook-associated protein 1 FlgK
MSLFYGLEIARTGLMVSSKALDVTGNNIANANTVGYTRQRLVLSSISSAAETHRFLNTGNVSVGGGVSITQLDQIRSSFLDSEYRRENADLSELNTRADTLEYIESLFNETSDSSISGALADFFDSIAELSKDPVSKEIRTNVQQNALKMTEIFNSYYDQLVELQKTQNDSMKTSVDRINDITESIAHYNDLITKYEVSGEKANELRDARNVLLDELSGYVNIDYSEDTDGHLTVSVEGTELVNHTNVTKLTTVADQTGAVTGQTGFYSIYLDGTTTDFNYSGGELKAYQQMRDGNSADDIGIPRIISNLNTLVQSIAKEFNAINSTGYTMPYDSTASRTGINMFDVPAGGYTNITAGNFSISDEVLDNVYNIAASSALIDLTADNDQQSNNENALKMVALTSSNAITTISNFEGYLKSTIVEIATESARAQSLQESQEAVINNLDTRRESISGVSTDEEMINLIQYQHAYSAASRVISTINEMLDTLINRTGV